MNYPTPTRRWAAARLVLATVALALLTGCAAVPGTALPEPPGDGTMNYRRDLAPAQQAQMATADRIRTLDPCGFINDAALATFGKLESIGQGQSFETCELRYVRGSAPAGITSVEVELGLHDIETPPRMVGGLPVRFRQADGCMVTVPYTPEAFVYWFHGTAGIDACPAAEVFVRAALPTLQTVPLRSVSPRVRNTRLAELDPCAALSILAPQAPKLRIDSEKLRPFRCRFLLDADNDKTAFNMTSTQKPLELIDGARRFEPQSVLEVEGTPWILDMNVPPASRTYCKADLYLDTAQPELRQVGWSRTEHWTDTVEMSTLSGCESLRRAATALAQMYRR
ncbi:DUF3558 domain-containing protein [Nocardia harenae]|uniref:DUF3558 domain-containing protein n=1 Tax=Nocardia harenae TaxID=358707 RepID=UPI00083613A3|nr:DUF3558 domain-containing protein [Nocardia harenae]